MTDKELEYLKNKISLELKKAYTQLGFEIICKRLEEAEKENAELAQQIEELKLHCRAVDGVNAKMKNCTNCKYASREEGHYDKCDSEYSEWELKEK
ncbi:hypothetical protein [Treponema peruense]|uniref:Uncharacterized protein n=1 Tax=Treponema peruense TaxID=2787628 RepID=A0A7T3V5R4_9SPIR|nr:hypothetical protein [Treponema peruense]QQA00049.1 hypothetical protein IWA51_07110 [Treponema peruense]QQA01344.1 hypothetical protein IWA51_01620 [Treponema peruense]